MIRLGTGKRLFEIDDEGRFARVGHVLGGPKPVCLDTGEGVATDGLPHQHGDLPVAYRGPCAFARGSIFWAATTYRFEEDDRGNPITVDVDPLLLVARLTPEGIQDPRLLPRLARQMSTDRLFVTRDGRHAVAAAEDAFDIVKTSGIRPATHVVDMGGQLIHGMDACGEMDLIAVGLFGRVACYDIEEGEKLGELKVEGENVSCVTLGGGRLASLSEDSYLHVVEMDRRRFPRDWSVVLRDRLPITSTIGPSEASLSHDGALLAVRRRRKDVLMLNLNDGTHQLLGGHTDRINFVRFIRGGRQLVTADKDNRVIFWPRSGERFISGE